jgi:hypothetical protein
MSIQARAGSERDLRESKPAWGRPATRGDLGLPLPACRGADGGGEGREGVGTCRPLEESSGGDALVGDRKLPAVELSPRWGR